MKSTFDLTDFLKLTKADGVLIFNSKGELLEYEHIEKAKNFAAMSAVIIKMAREFSEEINIGELKQFVFKAEKGVFVINNFEADFIIGVYSNNIAKTGLIMMAMDKLIKG